MADKQKKTTLYSSKQVHDIRKKLGLTQDEMAQLLGVSSKTISRWETTGIASKSGASVQKIIELERVIQNKTGLNAIKEVLSSTRGLLGISAAAALVSALSPIIGGGVFGISIGITLKNVIEKIIKNPK